jgi:hypothetical protein
VVVSVLCAAAAAGPFAAPPAGRAFATVAAAWVVVWNLVYLVLVTEGSRSW